MNQTYITISITARVVYTCIQTIGCIKYCMVGNFRVVFIFTFFASQEPFAKIKTPKFCCPCVKQTTRVSIPGLLLYSSLQKCVSECAFDSYHWSNPKCYINTDARSRQQCKAESRSNRHGSWIHRLRKLKPRKFLKSEFWPISQKFVPVKITNHTTVLEIIRYARFSK